MSSSSTTSKFKVGLFALIALASIVTLVLLLGLRKPPTHAFHTYFDESVQGLELGAPVKLRGVRIGSVSAIEIAPDHALVDVSLAIDRDEVRRLDLEHGAPRLRARLALQGVTGLKLVDIEVAGEPSRPPPELPFRPPARYIPSRPSLTQVLSDNAEAVSEQLPPILDRTLATITKLERIADEISQQRLPARVGAMVDAAHTTVTDMRRVVDRFDRARVPDRLAHTLDGLDAAVAKTSGVIDRLGGDSGLVASAHRAVDLFGDAGRDARGGAEELARALRDVGEAARSMRRFFDALDREPDMILKGRARERR